MTDINEGVVDREDDDTSGIARGFGGEARPGDRVIFISAR